MLSLGENLLVFIGGVHALLLYKTVNNLKTNYTRDPIPPHQQSQYSLQKHNVIGQIRTRAEKFKSTYPHCLNYVLETETRLALSVAILKKKNAIENFGPPPPWKTRP